MSRTGETLDVAPGTVGGVTDAGIAVDANTQAVWDANPDIHTQFGNDVQKFMTETQSQWSKHVPQQAHFMFASGPSGLDYYRKVWPAYYLLDTAHTITDLMDWIANNIQTVTFFGKKIPVHTSLATPLANAETAIKADPGGGAAAVTTVDGGFVPRVIEGTTQLSYHALGRAIDLNGANNPKLKVLLMHAVTSGVLANNVTSMFNVIKAVTGTDLLTTTVFPAQRTASTKFQSDFDAAWINGQTGTLAADVAAVRPALDQLKATGFLNHPQPVVDQMIAAGFRWGGAWGADKDYMHFETGTLTP
jgi:hypothetical protein